MQYRVDTLPNNLTVVRVPMPGVRSVTALALVKTGRRYEEEKLAGISHFLEHMVFKGTANYENAQVLSAVIDRVGGEFNAFTSKEYTGYYVKLAAPYLETALDVVTDMLCAPLLRQADIDRESGVIVEEINMYEDMPMRRVQDLFEEQVYAGSNLAGAILGTKETVTSLKTADFQHYMNEWYGFSNVVFIVAGDAEVVESPKVLERLTELTQKVGEKRKSNAQKPFHNAKYAKLRKQIVYKKTEQAHFVVGLPTFSRHDERRYALALLTNLLGKTMSSRLFSEIREKRGLCYYVRAEDEFYHDIGMLTGSAGVDPKRVNEAIEAMYTELLALREKKPVTAEELADAKQNMMGQILLDLEDSQSVAGWYGMKQLLQGKVETEEQVIEHLQAVTLDEVHSVVQDIIQEDQLRLTLIGPFTEKDITAA